MLKRPSKEHQSILAFFRLMIMDYDVSFTIFCFLPVFSVVNFKQMYIYVYAGARKEKEHLTV